MAFTLAQYNVLKDALASGTLEVEYLGKKLRYRSQSEMLALLRMMERELGIASSNGGMVPVQFDKGLGPSAPSEWC